MRTSGPKQPLAVGRPHMTTASPMGVYHTKGTLHPRAPPPLEGEPTIDWSPLVKGPCGQCSAEEQMMTVTAMVQRMSLAATAPWYSRVCRLAEAAEDMHSVAGDGGDRHRMQHSTVHSTGRRLWRCLRTLRMRDTHNSLDLLSSVMYDIVCVVSTMSYS